MCQWSIFEFKKEVCVFLMCLRLKKNISPKTLGLHCVYGLEVNPSNDCINIIFPRLSIPSFIGRFSFALIDEVITLLVIILLLSCKCS